MKVEKCLPQSPLFPLTPQFVLLHYLEKRLCLGKCAMERAYCLGILNQN